MAFVQAGKTAEIAPGTVHEVEIGGKPVAVANVGGKFYAISGTCLHRGGPLGQGSLDGTVLMCPWHGWQFDVTTGKVYGNATVGVDCYPLEVRGDELFVDVG